MTSLSRTVLNCEGEPAIICKQVQSPIVERVKSKGGTQICVQETAIPLEPVERSRVAQKHHVENSLKTSPNLVVDPPDHLLKRHG